MFVAWFETIPKKQVKQGQALVVYNGYGAEIWDLPHREVLWRSQGKGNL